MASVDILIEAADDAKAFQAVGALMGASCAPSTVHDHAPTDMREVNPAIEDHLTNGTYSPGDAFGSWVWYARSLSRREPQAGYYSREFGWSASRDLATRYDGAAPRPDNAPADAVLLHVDNL